MKLVLLISFLFLASCAKTQSGVILETSLSSVKMQEDLPIGGEGFPFLWEGRLLYLTATRTQNHGNGFFIYDGTSTVHTGPQDMAFVSGLVLGNTLYVIGVTQTQGFSPAKQNQILLTKTIDLQNWSTPKTIMISEPGEPYYNTSIAIDTKAGGFVMATEVYASTGFFNFYIAHSFNIENGWQRAVTELFSQSYAACPTIRVVNGQYVVFYLLALGLDAGPSSYRYVTAVARLPALYKGAFVQWEMGHRYLFAPIHGDNDNGVPSTNMSDFDYIETNWGLEMLIYNGNQSTWGKALRATYIGAISNLINELF